MREKVKQRIVGAVVLVALAVIFIPFLFTLEPPRPLDTDTLIPPAPDIREVTIDEPVRVDGITPPGAVDEVFLPSEPVATAQPGTFTSAPQEAPQKAIAAQDKPANQAPPASKPPATPAPRVAEARPSLAENTLQAWVVQVSSFRDKKTADDLNERLRLAGYKSYVRSAQAQGSLTYRVFVGPVSLRERALSDKAAIDIRFGVQSLVVSFEP